MESYSDDDGGFDDRMSEVSSLAAQDGEAKQTATVEQEHDDKSSEVVVAEKGEDLEANKELKTGDEYVEYKSESDISGYLVKFQSLMILQSSNLWLCSPFR